MRNRVTEYFRFPRQDDDKPHNLLAVAFIAGVGWYAGSALVQLWVFMAVKTWELLP